MIRHLDYDNPLDCGDIVIFGSHCSNFPVGSHDYGQTILLEEVNDTWLWGFALSPKLGTQNAVEIGFGSGQVNLKRNNGLKNPDLENPQDTKRASGVLNRTDQKKIVNYLKQGNYLNIDILELRNGVVGRGKYW